MLGFVWLELLGPGGGKKPKVQAEEHSILGIQVDLFVR